MFALVIALATAMGNQYTADWESSTPDCDRQRLCGSKGYCDEGEVCKDYLSFNTCADIWSYRFCDRECPPGETLDPTRYCKCISDADYNAYFCEEQCNCPEIYEPVECSTLRTGVHRYDNQCVASCQGGFSEFQCEPVQNASCEVCPSDYSPVICDDNSEFSNSCLAECMGKVGCRSRGQRINYRTLLQQLLGLYEIDRL